MEMSKAERTRALRYKRPALASLGYEAIRQEIWDIQEACADVHWFIEQNDETLLNALDGDEEAEWEFKMAFASLESKAEQLIQDMEEWNWCEDGEEFGQVYDDCTVALIGNRYTTIDFDANEEDYYSLTGYEQNLAQTKAGKRFMRKTKAEMLSIIGQCVGTLIAFLDLRQQYDYLKATMDILRDENTSLLTIIKQIDAAYEEANADGFYCWKDSSKQFDRLLDTLPDKIWLE